MNYLIIKIIKKLKFFEMMTFHEKIAGRQLDQKRLEKLTDEKNDFRQQRLIN